MNLRMFTDREIEIEPVILINTPGAGLDVESGEVRNVAVLKLRAADMERVTGILAPEIAARVGIRCEFKVEAAG